MERSLGKHTCQLKVCSRVYGDLLGLWGTGLREDWERKSPLEKMQYLPFTDEKQVVQAFKGSWTKDLILCQTSMFIKIYVKTSQDR